MKTYTKAECEIVKYGYKDVVFTSREYEGEEDEELLGLFNQFQ